MACVKSLNMGNKFLKDDYSSYTPIVIDQEIICPCCKRLIHIPKILTGYERRRFLLDQMYILLRQKERLEKVIKETGKLLRE